MPTTPRGIVYPASSDHTRIWEHLQDTAESVDAALAALACELTHSVAQNIPNNTYTPVTFDTEYFDNGGLHSSSGTRLTIPSGGGGVWSFAWTLAYTANATGFRIALLRVNGNTADMRGGVTVPASGAYNATFSGAHIGRLVDGDYVELVTMQNSGAGLVVLGANSASHILSLSAARIAT